MEGTMAYNIWIISGGRSIALDISTICEGSATVQCTEYRISEIARYMLNPGPITVPEKVIGCTVKYRRNPYGKIKRLIKKFINRGKDLPGDQPQTEEITSAFRAEAPCFRDKYLNAHLTQISELLRPYDPVLKKLGQLDRDRVEDITALCEDFTGDRYKLNLQGSAGDKINYVSGSLSHTVDAITFAYLKQGLFEMRGFDFSSFNANKYSLLIKFLYQNQIRYCVLDSSYRLEYWVNDTEMVNFAHILEQSVVTDQKLRDAFSLCAQGGARPLKLFFTERLKHKYSDKYLPSLYRELFESYSVAPRDKETIANMLNDHQSIVSFNYVPASERGKQKQLINISVLHDIRALDPIKNSIPSLYTDILSKTPESGIGKLYLLDSMQGYNNA